MLLLLGIGSAVFAQDGYEPIFEQHDCLFDVPGITCGTLTVPEDRADPQNNQVQLAVAIIQSRAANPPAEPVIYLEGGPGGAAILGVEDLQRHPIVDTHDLIVFDQRGTGFSLPSLNCPEAEAEAENSTELCRDRLLAEGVNLDAYNSANSAADVNDLRIALGYDQVNLWGISYGTKLALTTMRDWPEGIRSVIIDSIYPPEEDDLNTTITSFIDSYQNLFDRCAADADCSDAFPNLEDRFYNMIAELNNAPIIIETEDGEVELSGDEVLAQFFLALYDSEQLPYLPYALDLLAYGSEDDDSLMTGYDILTGAYIPDDDTEYPESVVMDSPGVQAYLDEYGDIEDSEGQNLSVDCSEEYQLNDVDSAYATAASAPEPLAGYFTAGIDSSLQDCDIWGVQTADPIEADRVISDIPTLAISGLMDPITPPSSGESAVIGLVNGWHVLFPTAGHGISATDNEAGGCAKSLVMAFLGNPFAQPDTSCVTETDVMTFYTGW